MADVVTNIIARDKTKAGLAAARKSVSTFSTDVKKITAGVIGADLISSAGRAAMAQAQAFFRSGIQFTRALETTGAQFRTLLGSDSLAQSQLNFVRQFAADTPFFIQQVADASRLLVQFTGSATEANKALELVGDAAAGSGADVSNVALWWGRLLDGLKNNRPVGEALARLQELGIISGQVRSEVEALVDAEKGQEAQQLITTKVTTTYEGAMSRLRGTIGGAIDTAQNATEELASIVLEVTGVTDALKDGANWWTDWANAAKDAIVDTESFLAAFAPKVAKDALAIQREWERRARKNLGPLGQMLWQGGFFEGSPLLGAGVTVVGDVPGQPPAVETAAARAARLRAEAIAARERARYTEEGQLPTGTPDLWRMMGADPILHDPVSQQTRNRAREFNLARANPALALQQRGFDFPIEEFTEHNTEIIEKGNIQQHQDFMKNIAAIQGVISGVDQLIALQQGGGSWWQKALTIAGVGVGIVGSLGTLSPALAGALPGVLTGAKGAALASTLTQVGRLGGVGGSRGQSNSAPRGGGRNITINSNISIDGDTWGRGIGNAVLEN